MVMASAWKADELVAKTTNFINSIETISQNIQDMDIYQISNKLKFCMSSVPENLVKGFSETKRIDRIRAYVKLNGAMEECKSYLDLIESLRYYKTSDMKAKLDEINEEIMSSYQITVN
jgi:four helix bundle protein